MAKKKTRKKSVGKKYSGTELNQGYEKGTDSNLFLDRPFMALSNLSKKKNGKEVPVNVQISDYLKSMKLLEKSTLSLEETVEKCSIILESKIVKKKIKGRNYTTTVKMIEAVRAIDNGKINSIELKKLASWAEDPDSAILVARIIGRLE